MVFGILSTLSILFYSKEDEQILDQISVLDVFRIPFDAGVRALSSGIHNQLRLFGALVSDFFINSTIGYSSIVIPLLAIAWGWVILRSKETARFLVFTNYSMVFGLLFSTGFGITNRIFYTTAADAKVWSGIMGAFTAEILINILGPVGSSIVVIALLLVTVILAVDLDLHRSLERASSFWSDLRSELGKKREDEEEATDEEKSPFDEEEEEETGSVEEEEIERKKAFEVKIRALAESKAAAAGAEDEEASDEPPPPVRRPVVREEESATVEIEDEGEIPESEKPSDDAAEEEIDYVFPSVDLLDMPHQSDTVDDAELKANAQLVRAKLANFGIEIESVSVMPGPVITLYELVPASGVKISRIVNLADDLALALAAKGIRIIAPIPGKSAVGVEIPNRNPSFVHLRSIINSTRFRESKAALSIALGKTISGEVYTDDLGKMPHLLIAGSTGSGKSVGINTILAGLLFRLHPSDVKFIIIDPKKIELTPYKKLSRHFLAVSPDIDEEIITVPENAVAVLKSVELEMEKRYDRLAAAGVRNILDYNDRLKAGRLKDTEKITHRKMPYLVLIIDELADLMITAAKDVEEPIARLAQLARAVGIHLILATQRPSVDVITGVIKANFPARIAYQVASKTDSRTILDMNGAEQLLGSGDMLYLPSGSPKPTRIQNAYITTDEVERITDHIGKQKGYSKPFYLPSILEKKSRGGAGTSASRDEFFEEAARLVVRHQQGSVSLIQRRLKVGYSRAARIIDELEAAGVVGPFDGSKARLVLIDTEDQLDRILELM